MNYSDEAMQILHDADCNGKELMEDMFRFMVRHAQAYLTKTYISRGGLERNKRKKELHQSHLVLEELAKFMSHHLPYTTTFWHGAAIEVAVKAIKKEGAS